MCDWHLNTLLPNDLLQRTEDRRRSFPPLQLQKKILDSLSLLIPKARRRNLGLTMRPRFFGLMTK